MIRIELATTASNGFIILVDSRDDGTSTATVIGQAYRASIDGEPQSWKAWLWKQAGRYPARGEHSDAITAATPQALESRLRKRHAAKGAWWVS